jgi:hypothetical protein
VSNKEQKKRRKPYNKKKNYSRKNTVASQESLRKLQEHFNENYRSR